MIKTNLAVWSDAVFMLRRERFNKLASSLNKAEIIDEQAASARARNREGKRVIETSNNI